MKKLMIIASSAFLMSIGIANAQVEDQETQTPSTQYQEGVESSEMPQDSLEQSNEFNQDTDAVTPDATTPDATTAPDATTPLPEEDQTVSPEDQSSDYSSDETDAIRKDDETSAEETDESVEN